MKFFNSALCISMALLSGCDGYKVISDHEAPLNHPSHDVYWDWSHINTSNLVFPKTFLWGAATAAHQIEGNCNNDNWHGWERLIRPYGATPTVKDCTTSSPSCDHWNRKDEAIKNLKEIGLNAYRLSIDWGKIEPQEGTFDYDALQHYLDECAALRRNGIEPMVTLHHFTHPAWFERKGAFLKKRNIDYFVRFSRIICDALHTHVALWCTINEPATYLAHTYITGLFPPGTKFNFKRTLKALKNMMVAHTRVYRELKRQQYGTEISIGLAKNITQFDPLSHWNPLDVLVCKQLNHVFNNAVLEFFKSGRLHATVPGIASCHHYDYHAPETLDFAGLNYYSHFIVGIRPYTKQILYQLGDDVMTDMPFAIYAEGLYRAIHQIAQLKKPLYITENGIADHNDSRRTEFFRKYLYVLSRALREGFDIRGYFYWSLMDNFEWSEGYTTRFGLYHVDFDSQKRTMRKSAAFLQKIIMQNRR